MYGFGALRSTLSAACAGAWSVVVLLIFLLPGFSREVAVFPVMERTIVQHDVVAETARGKQHRGGLHPEVTITDHGVALLHACTREPFRKLIRRTHDVRIVRDLVEREVLRSRDVP